MAQLIALYIEGNTLCSYEGTTHARTDIPKTLLSVTKPYGDAFDWATTTAASLLSPHDAVVILDGNFDDSLENVAKADFKGFHEVSGAGFMKLLQAAIVKYVADNAKEGFKLREGKFRYFCPQCNQIHLAPHSIAMGADFGPMMEFPLNDGTSDTHRAYQNQAIPYSMFKHLTTPLA